MNENFSFVVLRFDSQAERLHLEECLDIAENVKVNNGLRLPDAMQRAMSKRTREGIQPRDWAMFSYVGR
jgi:hypothetical protein